MLRIAGVIGLAVLTTTTAAVLLAPSASAMVVRHCGRTRVATGGHAKVGVVHVSCRIGDQVARAYYRKVARGAPPDGQTRRRGIYFRVRGFRCFTGLAESEAFCNRGPHKHVFATTQPGEGLPRVEARRTRARSRVSDTAAASARSKGARVRAVALTAPGPFHTTVVKRVRIYRNGVRLVNRRVHAICDSCHAIAGSPGNSFIHIRELDSTPDPEVYFDLYSGGAHCCLYDVFFDYEASSHGYGRLTHNFFDSGYRLRFLDRGPTPEFASLDDHFAYRFSSYAGSLYPPEIWVYRHGSLLDRTRAFPRSVRKSARRMHRKYERKRGHADVRPALAVYVADECLLGRSRHGLRLLDHALRRGYLARQTRYDEGPKGPRYVRALRLLLRRRGYL